MPARFLVDKSFWSDAAVLSLRNADLKLVLLALFHCADREGIVEIGSGFSGGTLAPSPVLAQCGGVAEDVGPEQVEKTINMIDGRIGFKYEHNGNFYMVLPGIVKHNNLRRSAVTHHPRPPEDVLERVLEKYPDYLGKLMKSESIQIETLPAHYRERLECSRRTPAEEN